MFPFSPLYALSISWFSVNGMRILFVIAGAYLAIKIIALLTNRILEHAMRSDFLAAAEDEQKRRETLARVVIRTAEVALYSIAGMMVLSEFGVNIGPLIAGAGIMGIAIGFGAQQLVKDTISGIFIILENRYHVGDSVVINGVTGIVDDLNLRVTCIKDIDGAMHYVPNGSIVTCANLSAEGGRVHFPLKVSSKADLNRVREIVSAVGDTFMQNEQTKMNIRKTPAIVRIESFDKEWMTVRVSGDVVTSKQWETLSALKLQLKQAFDEAGIEASA